MPDAWCINSGPEPHPPRTPSEDNVSWVYGVAKSPAERGSVVFTLTRSAFQTAEGGDAPLQLEDAFRDKGRSLVEASLRMNPRPTRIVMDSMGRVSYE